MAPLALVTAAMRRLCCSSLGIGAMVGQDRLVNYFFLITGGTRNQAASTGYRSETLLCAELVGVGKIFSSAQFIYVYLCDRVLKSLLKTGE